MATGTHSDPQQDPSPPRKAPAEEAKQAAKEQAGAVWNDAKETARSTITDQQHRAASGLGDFAGVLRNAARQLEGEKHASVGRLAESAADSLERLSGTLRAKDLNAMVRDAENFARNQPVAFLGAAVVAGFLAVRFLKSSQEHPTSSHDLTTRTGASAGAEVPPYTRV